MYFCLQQFLHEVWTLRQNCFWVVAPAWGKWKSWKSRCDFLFFISSLHSLENTGFWWVPNHSTNYIDIANWGFMRTQDRKECRRLWPLASVIACSHDICTLFRKISSYFKIRQCFTTVVHVPRLFQNLNFLFVRKLLICSLNLLMICLNPFVLLPF